MLHQVLLGLSNSQQVGFSLRLRSNQRVLQVLHALTLFVFLTLVPLPSATFSRYLHVVAAVLFLACGDLFRLTADLA